MKTYRNHRNRTGRHKRHVKHRVQTRINHRKGVVSSRRRHKFFKRGGQHGTYRNGNSTTSILVEPLTQLNQDRINTENAAKEKEKQDAEKINYKAVVDFVENIITTNTFKIIGEYGNIGLTVKELEKIVFYTGNVKKDQTPVTKKINDFTVTFYINDDGNTVVIYVDNILYGYVMIKINGKEYESNNRGIYNIRVSIAIIEDLKVSSPT